MAETPIPVFRRVEELVLNGTMALYQSQAELSERIPHQWRQFRSRHPELESNAAFYGASPSTNDRKIHFLTGVAPASPGDFAPDEPLLLEAGEYAVVRVDDTALLRATWTWLLDCWLPASGRQEKNAPEFERYTGLSEAGLPIGPVDIYLPLEPLATGPSQRS